MGLRIRLTRSTLVAVYCFVSTLLSAFTPGQIGGGTLGRDTAGAAAHAASIPLDRVAVKRAAAARARVTVRASTAAGSASGFVYESFKSSTPDNAGWVLGGTNYTAHLTAGDADPTTSGHAGSSDGQGGGWLRLTSADAKGYCGGANDYCPVVGYAYYNVPVTLAHGLVVSFDYACWGGGPYSGTGYGSDGTSFFLFDGSAAFSPGGDGGGLGYNAGAVYPGMPGAYAGVGLDEFGSFTGLGFENQGVGIRGSAPNYTLLSNSTHTAGGQLCAESSASRPATYGTGYQHYVIAVTPDLRVTVAASTPGGATVLIDRYSLQGAAGMAALPSTLKFGFAASQGGISDVHEIRNVSVSGIGASTAEIMCGCNQSENLGTGVRSYTHNPVTLPTGDFYHSFTDFSIPGRGVPLHVTRTYNALLAGQNGPLGYGWSSDQTASLSTDATGAVTVTQEDGSVVPFSRTAPATYQARAACWPHSSRTAMGR